MVKRAQEREMDERLDAAGESIGSPSTDKMTGRAQRLAFVREEVRRGTYKVDSRLVANRLLNGMRLRGAIRSA